jgi:hypothetical protein
MKRPDPYYVSSGMVTPDEPRSGWYWGYEDDEGETVIRGDYGSRRDAIEAIDRFMFNRGLLEDGSQP